MLRRLITVIAIALLLPTFSLANAHKKNGGLQSMLAKVKPAIVNISVVRLNHTLNQQGPQTPEKVMTVGSGVILNAEHGMILTNAHVIDHAQLIVVTLQDGRRFVGNIIGQDNDFDLAVVHITAKDLTSIPFARDGDIHVGDSVVAIGSPFGLTESVTSGVISALDRPALSPENSLQDLIQTDAPINMGNSGGGLINRGGELVGINTAIITPNSGSIGIGFAIPSAIARSVALQLIHFGKVKRGLLGVVVQNTTRELSDVLHLSKHKGALISQVLPGSAAEKASLQPLDLIESVNDHPIHNSGELHNLLAVTPPKEKLQLHIQRAGKQITVKATTGSPNDPSKQAVLPFLNGTTLRETRRILPTSVTISNGILVSHLADSSPASLAGIALGDVILSANNSDTPSLEALLKVLKKNPKHLLLLLNRAGKNLYVVINPPAKSNEDKKHI